MAGKHIAYFKGEHDWLSNMYDIPVTYNGYTFQNSESAFQAQKCPQYVEKFVNLSGYDAKSLGKSLPLREDWAEVRVGIMTEIVYAKFSQNSELKRKLLETGNVHLREGNTWGDKFWGVCDGCGMNMLGKILMRVREELKNE